MVQFIMRYDQGNRKKENNLRRGNPVKVINESLN